MIETTSFMQFTAPTTTDAAAPSANKKRKAKSSSNAMPPKQQRKSAAVSTELLNQLYTVARVMERPWTIHKVEGLLDLTKLPSIRVRTIFKGNPNESSIPALLNTTLNLTIDVQLVAFNDKICKEWEVELCLYAGNEKIDDGIKSASGCFSVAETSVAGIATGSIRFFLAATSFGSSDYDIKVFHMGLCLTSKPESSEVSSSPEKTVIRIRSPCFLTYTKDEAASKICKMAIKKLFGDDGIPPLQALVPKAESSLGSLTNCTIELDKPSSSKPALQISTQERSVLQENVPQDSSASEEHERANEPAPKKRIRTKPPAIIVPDLVRLPVWHCSETVDCTWDQDAPLLFDSMLIDDASPISDIPTPRALQHCNNSHQSSSASLLGISPFDPLEDVS